LAQDFLIYRLLIYRHIYELEEYQKIISDCFLTNIHFSDMFRHEIVESHQSYAGYVNELCILYLTVTNYDPADLYKSCSKQIGSNIM